MAACSLCFDCTEQVAVVSDHAAGDAAQVRQLWRRIFHPVSYTHLDVYKRQGQQDPLTAASERLSQPKQRAGLAASADQADHGRYIGTNATRNEVAVARSTQEMNAGHAAIDPGCGATPCGPKK